MNSWAKLLCRVILAGFLTAVKTGMADAPLWLVRDGRPMAGIVIAENPPRMVTLAAEELRDYILKISGAELPIDHAPDPSWPAAIYVGRSGYTDELGVNDENLAYGAFRMIIRPGHLVLLGRDFDFVPREPHSSGRSDQARVMAEWDRLTADRTDTAWGNPMLSVWRFFNNSTQTWTHDEGGSLQAVYELLRMLGVRWYMPGDIGEVVPESSSISLPTADREVRPAFGLRHFMGPAYMNAPREAVLWGRRLGLNYGYEMLGAGNKTHGLANVYARPEMHAAHPEYFALARDGTRNFRHACFSSVGLLQETANYARAVFDIYDEATLQLSPQDGLRMCLCEQCGAGSISDAVWGFLDRVAREVRVTHPDRLLIGAAYTSYREPPESIDRLGPNIAVRINNVGRPTLDVPERREWYRNLVQTWQAKTASGKIVRVENNYYNAVIHPRMIAEDLRFMRGISLGEMNEVSRQSLPEAAGRGQTWGSPGLNHLNLYVNAAFLWDPDRDLEALLDEYYALFYGPAADAMRAAFDFAESAYAREGRARLELAERIGFVERLHAARSAAGDGVYGQRIQLILDELDGLETLQDMHAINTQRDDNPIYRFWYLGNSKWDQAWRDTVVDGRLDESYWRRRSVLRHQATGGRLKLHTSFSLLPGRGVLCVGIVCNDVPGEALNVAAVGDGDPAILDGDYVELLLETDAHAFYRIVINPAGARLEEDMSKDGVGAAWSSNAEVAVAVGEDGWTVEMHIPLVPESEGAGDPNHYVLYRRMPSELWPWHFNIARVRARAGEMESAVFAPPGEGGLHDRVSFGRLLR